MYPGDLEAEHAQALRALHLERARQRALGVEARRAHTAACRPGVRRMRGMRVTPASFAARAAALLRLASAALAEVAERLDPPGAAKAPPATGGARLRAA